MNLMLSVNLENRLKRQGVSGAFIYFAGYQIQAIEIRSQGYKLYLN